MAHSSDLRKRVLEFIANGGSKAEASRRFSVGRAAIYRWLNTPDPLKCGKPGPRKPRLLDPVALTEHVKAHPDQTLAERARHFGVSESCVAYGLQRLGYTRKKNTWV
jgi:transposase